MIALWTAPQGGAWTRLPGTVTAWSILRTDRLGKDSFRVELADAALPDGRLRFSARVDGVGWFTGLADEVLRTESGAGRRLVLRGRGMDALLEDCEFDAQTGTGITPGGACHPRAPAGGAFCLERCAVGHGHPQNSPRQHGQLDRAGLLRLGRGYCRRVCWQTAGCA